MENVTIKAETRTVLRKGLGRLRRSGKVPGVVYGPATSPMPLQLDARDASITLNRLHGTVLIDLEVDGQVRKTLVREIQRDFISGALIHVDFMEVAMDQMIVASVSIVLVGDAPALTRGDFVVVQNLMEAEIECLPGNLMSVLEVSVEELHDIGDTVTVDEIYVPEGVTLLADPHEVVARIAYAMAAVEEEEEVPAEAAADEVEVIEKGRYAAEDEAAAERSADSEED